MSTLAPDEIPTCFLARFSESPCVGRLVRAHLIKQQTLVREVGPEAPKHPATWVWSCGGHGFGNAGHHGELDGLQIRIPRLELPAELEAWAEANRIGWWLTKRYGARA